MLSPGAAGTFPGNARDLTACVQNHSPHGCPPAIADLANSHTLYRQPAARVRQRWLTEPLFVRAKRTSTVTQQQVASCRGRHIASAPDPSRPRTCSWAQACGSAPDPQPRRPRLHALLPSHPAHRTPLYTSSSHLAAIARACADALCTTAVPPRDRTIEPSTCGHVISHKCTP